MIEDRTGIGQLIKERIARFRHLLVHKLSAKEIKVGTIKEKVPDSGVTIGSEVIIASGKGLTLASGTLDLIHTATENDDHAVELDVDAAG